MPLSHTLLSLLVSLLCLSIYLYLKYLRPPPPLRNLPSPKQSFFLFRLLHEPAIAEIEAWIDQVPNDGLIRYRGVFNQTRLLVTSPEAAKDLLYRQCYSFVKPKLQFDLAKNVVAEGLLLQEGSVHKAARKAMQPAFHSERIRDGYGVMWKASKDLVDVVTPKEEGQGVQFLRPVFATTLDVVGRWAFSTEFNATKNPRSSFGRPYMELLKTTPHGQRALSWTSVTGVGFFMRLPIRPVRTIRSIVDKVIKTASEIVAQHGKWSPGPDGEKGPHQDDMLSIMMKSKHFSTQDLVVQTVHFLAAATETTAGSISWALHLLSRHPRIQSRLRDEIREHISSADTCSGQESDFQGMKYLDAVIKEVLRFHSINTILWRQCIAPNAEIAGVQIPVGTQVVYSPWTMNRDPKIWGPDARSFRPERWIENNNGGAEHSYSFLTFGKS